jgi:hypothetical protein
MALCVRLARIRQLVLADLRPAAAASSYLPGSAQSLQPRVRVRLWQCCGNESRQARGCATCTILLMGNRLPKGAVRLAAQVGAEGAPNYIRFALFAYAVARLCCAQGRRATLRSRRPWRGRAPSLQVSRSPAPGAPLRRPHYGGSKLSPYGAYPSPRVCSAL